MSNLKDEEKYAKLTDLHQQNARLFTQQKIYLTYLKDMSQDLDEIKRNEEILLMLKENFLKSLYDLLDSGFL